MRNDDAGTSAIALIIVLGFILLIGYIGASLEKNPCIKYNCDREAASGSSYCYLHKPSYSYTTKPKSSSSGSSSYS